MTLTLSCQKRPEGTKPNALRREGLIPASLYGHQGAESVSLVLKQKEAEMLLRKVSVNKTVIDLSVEDLSWNGQVLIREVQNHPWKKYLYHLSFFSVKPEAATEAEPAPSAQVETVAETTEG